MSPTIWTNAGLRDARRMVPRERPFCRSSFSLIVCSEKRYGRLTGTALGSPMPNEAAEGTGEEGARHHSHSRERYRRTHRRACISRRPVAFFCFLMAFEMPRHRANGSTVVYIPYAGARPVGRAPLVSRPLRPR